MRNDFPGNVAVDRLRADRQQGSQFHSSQEIGAASQAVEYVHWIGYVYWIGNSVSSSARILGTGWPAPLNPCWGSVACLVRKSGHGNGCTSGC
jgi:hypothetical protein